MIFYIGVSGKMGSGKDTVAKIISEHLNSLGCRTAIVPFALELKRMVMELFGFSEEEVYKTKPPEVRRILQMFGTNVIRERDENFWIRMLEKNAEKVDNPFGYVFVIVPDVRFYNEAQFIRSRGGLLIRVERDQNPTVMVDNTEESGAKLHLSETDLDHRSYMFHQVINNNWSLKELEEFTLGRLSAITSCKTLEELECGMRKRASQ